VNQFFGSFGLVLVIFGKTLVGIVSNFPTEYASFVVAAGGGNSGKGNVD